MWAVRPENSLLRGSSLDSKADKGKGDGPESWVVAQLGQRLAARVPAAVLGGLSAVGGILTIARLRVEG